MTSYEIQQLMQSYLPSVGRRTITVESEFWLPRDLLLLSEVVRKIPLASVKAQLTNRPCESK